MSNGLAIEYLSAAPLVRPVFFVVGAILARFILSEKASIGRLAFLGGLAAVIVAANLGLAVVATLAPPFWTSPNADLLLPGEAVPVIGTAHTAILICMELAIWAAGGFAIWAIASARSRNASGSNGWAVRCFLPIVNLVAVSYLLFKGQHIADVEEEMEVGRSVWPSAFHGQ